MGFFFPKSKMIKPRLNILFQTSAMKYPAFSATALGENVLNANHSDPSRTIGSHNAPEQVTAKTNSGEGKTKTTAACSHLPTVGGQRKLLG